MSNKKEENKDKIVKRFSLSAEERLEIEDINNVIALMRVQREGLSNSIDIALMRVRHRLGLTSNNAPEGYTRSVSFDYKTFEMVVEDTLKPPIPVA